MTHLTITEDPGEEFVFRGINTIIGLRDDGVIFYADVTKVHVVPERETFTIQVMTPALEVEMDFADADRVRKALELFETKKVLEVNSDPPGFVRITPSLGNTEGFEEPFIKLESNDGTLEEVSSRRKHQSLGRSDRPG
jgi:hypothetical protein